MTAEPVQPAAPPLPGRPVIRQHWGDVAFLHWRVDPAEVAPLLPSGTRPDTFDGSSWVGLIPFRLSRSAFLGGPPVPVLVPRSTCACTPSTTRAGAASSSARWRRRG